MKKPLPENFIELALAGTIIAIALAVLGSSIHVSAEASRPQMEATSSYLAEAKAGGLQPLAKVLPPAVVSQPEPPSSAASAAQSSSAEPAPFIWGCGDESCH